MPIESVTETVACCLPPFTGNMAEAVAQFGVISLDHRVHPRACRVHRELAVLEHLDDLLAGEAIRLRLAAAGIDEIDEVLECLDRLRLAEHRLAVGVEDVAAVVPEEVVEEGVDLDAAGRHAQAVVARRVRCLDGSVLELVPVRRRLEARLGEQVLVIEQQAGGRRDGDAVGLAVKHAGVEQLRDEAVLEVALEHVIERGELAQPGELGDPARRVAEDARCLAGAHAHGELVVHLVPRRRLERDLDLARVGGVEVVDDLRHEVDGLGTVLGEQEAKLDLAPAAGSLAGGRRCGRRAVATCRARGAAATAGGRDEAECQPRDQGRAGHPSPPRPRPIRTIHVLSSSSPAWMRSRIDRDNNCLFLTECYKLTPLEYRRCQRPWQADVAHREDRPREGTAGGP